MNNWGKINTACGLLIDPSTGAIGVLRKTTISLFRSLEDVEHMGHGNFSFLFNFIIFTTFCSGI